jgi:hypothetical protein
MNLMLGTLRSGSMPNLASSVFAGGFLEKVTGAQWNLQ